MKYKPIYQAILPIFLTEEVSRTQKHLLKDILVIAIYRTIAGAEGWKDIENYGISKQ